MLNNRDNCQNIFLENFDLDFNINDIDISCPVYLEKYLIARMLTIYIKSPKSYKNDFKFWSIGGEEGIMVKLENDNIEICEDDFGSNDLIDNLCKIGSLSDRDSGFKIKFSNKWKNNLIIFNNFRNAIALELRSLVELKNKSKNLSLKAREYIEDFKFNIINKNIKQSEEIYHSIINLDSDIKINIAQQADLVDKIHQQIDGLAVQRELWFRNINNIDKNVSAGNSYESVSDIIKEKFSLECFVYLKNYLLGNSTSDWNVCLNNIDIQPKTLSEFISLCMRQDLFCLIWIIDYLKQANLATSENIDLLYNAAEFPSGNNELITQKLASIYNNMTLLWNDDWHLLCQDHLDILFNKRTMLSKTCNDRVTSGIGLTHLDQESTQQRWSMLSMGVESKIADLVKRQSLIDIFNFAKNIRQKIAMYENDIKSELVAIIQSKPSEASIKRNEILLLINDNELTAYWKRGQTMISSAIKINDDIQNNVLSLIINSNGQTTNPRLIKKIIQIFSCAFTETSPQNFGLIRNRQVSCDVFSKVPTWSVANPAIFNSLCELCDNLYDKMSVLNNCDHLIEKDHLSEVSCLPKIIENKYEIKTICTLPVLTMRIVLDKNTNTNQYIKTIVSAIDILTMYESLQQIHDHYFNPLQLKQYNNENEFLSLLGEMVFHLVRLYPLLRGGAAVIQWTPVRSFPSVIPACFSGNPFSGLMLNNY